MLRALPRSCLALQSGLSDKPSVPPVSRTFRFWSSATNQRPRRRRKGHNPFWKNAISETSSFASLLASVRRGKQPEHLPFGSLCHLQDIQLVLREMPVDTFLDKVTQRIRLHRIQLAGKTVRPCLVCRRYALVIARREVEGNDLFLAVSSSWLLPRSELPAAEVYGASRI